MIIDNQRFCKKCLNISDMSFEYTPGSIKYLYNDTKANLPELFSYCIDCRCPICNSRTFQIDRNIMKHISLLNTHGFNTSYSCEGHPKYDSNKLITEAYILFNSHTRLSKKMIKMLPPMWKHRIAPIMKRKSPDKFHFPWNEYFICKRDKIYVDFDDEDNQKAIVCMGFEKFQTLYLDALYEWILNIIKMKGK